MTWKPELFWTQEYDLPPGVGYPLWGAVHLAQAAAVILIIAAVLCAAGRRRKPDGMPRYVRIIPAVMLVMEIVKDLYLVRVGHFGLGYLPLHLCSLGIPVFLLSAFLPRPRGRTFFAEIALVLILPGSIMAILFPNWTMYPVWNFMNLYSWAWHLLLVLYPLLLLRLGAARPSIRHILFPVIFLAAVVPPIYLFDRAYSCNYLFLLQPLPGTPLMWFHTMFPGRYLAAYAAAALAVIVSVYGVYALLLRAVESRSPRREQEM